MKQVNYNIEGKIGKGVDLFKEEDYDCADPEILEILSYYRITRDIAERNNQEGLRLWQKAKILNGKNRGVTII